MQKNTVSIDTSQSPAKIEFSPEFNVAVPFIDCHLLEGRKDKVIIRETGGEEVTYGQLSERVNQSGNALKNLGHAHAFILFQIPSRSLQQAQEVAWR